MQIHSNPFSDSFTIKADGLCEFTIFNSPGQPGLNIIAFAKTTLQVN